ncbi:MAG: hypothetical protein Q8O37_09020 [Sulfuricellaceae bacterium]|nr:hypothetical protein [Sulfuricellaceae bacterium]
MQTNEVTTPQPAHTLPQLATIEGTCKAFPHLGLTPASVRAHIFNADDRTNSRGDKIKGNGLGATCAIIRRGKRVYINLPLYAAWLAGSAK